MYCAVVPIKTHIGNSVQTPCPRPPANSRSIRSTMREADFRQSPPPVQTASIYLASLGSVRISLPS
jgi:hypothetical protein